MEKVATQNLKAELSAYLDRLRSHETEKLVSDIRCCSEVDRCFTQCMDLSCEYHSFMLLLRTPCTDLRSEVGKWLASIGECDLAATLEKPSQCPEQSFCAKFCAADCELGKLLHSLGAQG